MKKTFIAIVAAGMTLASCGTAGNLLGMGGTTTTATTSTTTTGTGSMLNNLLTGLVSKAVPVTAESLVGNWTYDSPECRFESENFLAQAGGEIAAATVESKLGETLGKIGITRGTCTFTFNNDKTCSVTIGNKPIISGTYTVNSQTRQLNIKSSMGLVSMTGQVYVVGNTMTVLYDAQKLMTLMKSVGALSGNVSAATSTLASVLEQYKGMQLGMNMKK